MDAHPFFAAGDSNMVRLRLAGSPTARRRRRGGTACAGPPAVGEPPTPFRPALGGPRSPDTATSAHLPDDAVYAIIRQALLLWPQEPIVLLQQCGAQDAAAELLRSAGKYNYQTVSPDQCTTFAMPTPISLSAESDKCEATGAHCAPPNDTWPVSLQVVATLSFSPLACVCVCVCVCKFVCVYMCRA